MLTVYHAYQYIEKKTKMLLLQLCLGFLLLITASDIAQETSKDSVLSRIYQYVMEGWPHGGEEDT